MIKKPPIAFAGHKIINVRCDRASPKVRLNLACISQVFKPFFVRRTSSKPSKPSKPSKVPHLAPCNA